jgi:adenylate kinase family enzyme
MAFVILIGASGSGKTTIARAIASHYSGEARSSILIISECRRCNR